MDQNVKTVANDKVKNYTYLLKKERTEKKQAADYIFILFTRTNAMRPRSPRKRETSPCQIAD